MTMTKNRAGTEEEKAAQSTIISRVQEARGQVQIAELETLIGKLTEVDKDHRSLIGKQQAEINRLRRMEIEATKFAKMVTLPNGDLYTGAVYEAADLDGDGIMDTHVLKYEREDTIKLTAADRLKMAQLQKKMQGLAGGDPEKDALGYLASFEGSGQGAPEVVDILDNAVAAAEQDL